MFMVELYHSGFGIDVNSNKDVYIASGRRFETGSEPDVFSFGGAVSMLIGNRTSAIKDIDYLDIFKLVEKHNIELLQQSYQLFVI